ncbi:unnamed protein product [Auanema sp. JU1783]|nr:unnamed protein product [Auanema sp. JU1783]
MSDKGDDGQVFVVDNRTRDDMVRNVLLIILIFVCPPAAIAVASNECNLHVCVSFFLMCFFLIPAYIHGIWYCYFRKTPELVIA